MAEFEGFVQRFKAAQADIKAVGDEVAAKYPDSETVKEAVTEIQAATEALQALIETLAGTLEEAEVNGDLFKDLMNQADNSEIYAKFSPEERKQLVEWLVKEKQPLAGEDMLAGYVEKSLGQKPVEELLKMYPKAKLINRGSQMDDGSDAFDAYSAGLDAYKEEFETNKEKAVKDLAKIWLDKGTEAVAREFYAEALKSPEDEQ